MFSSNSTKRVTKHNSNPPENQLEKITVSDSKLSEKMDCIPAGYEDYIFFTISATGLEIHYSPNYEKLQPSDISEFAAICNRRLTRPINELDAIYRRNSFVNKNLQNSISLNFVF